MTKNMTRKKERLFLRKVSVRMNPEKIERYRKF